MLVLMFQREVADRLVASPGSRTYGRLSVAAQWRCEVKPLFTQGILDLIGINTFVLSHPMAWFAEEHYENLQEVLPVIFIYTIKEMNLLNLNQWNLSIGELEFKQGTLWTGMVTTVCLQLRVIYAVMVMLTIRLHLVELILPTLSEQILEIRQVRMVTTF